MKKIIIFLLFVVIINIAFAEWKESPTNPIFGQSVGGPKAYYPSVIYDVNRFNDNTSYYKIWYGTSGSQTGLAVSDDGINWTDQGIVMTNGYHSHVIYGDFGGGIYYKMWYWDGSLLYTIDDIKYTESTDGLNWTSDQAITQIGDTVINNTGSNWNRGTYGVMDVFYNSSGSDVYNDTAIWNNKYVMYYDATTGGSESIGLAYSVDSLEWKGYGEILAGAGGTEWDKDYTTIGTVINNNFNKWIMYYSGGAGKSNHGIGVAHSTDGLSWTRNETNPLMHKDDGVAYRDERTYTPSVICDSSSGFSGNGDFVECKMWFTCKGGGNYNICYSTKNFTDFDRDGFNSTIDCDDTNSSINPNATESCNLVDDNCNSIIDEENSTDCSLFYYDFDGDGYGMEDNKCLCSLSGIYNITINNDCDDNNSNINPSASEVCDGVDNNCDANVDEGCGGDSPSPGGGRRITPPEPIIEEPILEGCSENLICGNWEECVDDIQTRLCANECGYSIKNKKDCISEEVSQTEEISEENLVEFRPSWFRGLFNSFGRDVNATVGSAVSIFTLGRGGHINKEGLFGLGILLFILMLLLMAYYIIKKDKKEKSKEK